MIVDGKDLSDISIKDAMRELMSHDGPTQTITVNILRNWSQAKIKRFALHLLGDDYQERGEE